MSEAFKILPMREEHLSALAEIERLCFSDPWSENALREEIANPVAVFLVAVFGDRPAGYAGMHHVLEEGDILNVAVHPEFRKRGVATALLGELIRFGGQNGMEKLSLEVRPSNRDALRVYEKAGFRKVGERRGFYINPSENALILNRPLDGNGETEMTL